MMNLFLMPMWFLSGALFPSGGAWGGLRVVMLANPLTYGLAGLRRAMYLGHANASFGGVPPLGPSVAISVLFAAGMFVLAARIASRPARADLE